MTMDMLNWNRLSNCQRARWHDVVFYVFDTPTRMTRLRIYREPKMLRGETLWATMETEHFNLPCDAEFVSEAVAKRTAENYLRSEIAARGEASRRDDELTQAASRITTASRTAPRVFGMW